MFKDIVISVLGAVILSETPVLTYDQSIQWVIVMGLAVILFIFLLFLEEQAEKARRVRKIRQILQRLKNLKLRRAA